VGVLAAAAVAYLGLRAAVLGGLSLPREEIPFPDNPAALAPAGARILTALSVIGRYVALLVAPIDLSADYSHAEIPVLDTAPDGWVALGAGWLAAAVVLPFVAHRWARFAAFGLLFFWTTLSVASNLLFPVGTIMAERLLYLPAVGFCILLAGGLSSLGRRELRWGLVGVLAILFGMRTVDRNIDWRDRASLAVATARSSPGSAKARFNLGNALLAEARERVRQGDRDGAIERYAAASVEYRAAVSSYPQYGKAWLNLGAAALESGDAAAAEQALREAARIEPQWDAPWYNLGRARLASGDVDGAIEAFEEAAVRSNRPRQSSLILLELGRARERSGDREGARAAFEDALEADPRNPDALVRVAAYRMEDGRVGDARDLLRTALQVAPAHPEALRLRQLLDSRRR
jgi:tetratricopeptide (TPR) repeat protein